MISLSRHYSSLARVDKHPALKFSALFVAFLLTLSFFALILFPWVQTVVGKGKVIAYLPNERQQTVEAPIAGRISSWEVSEGEEVKEGEILAKLTDLDPGYLERIEQRLVAAKSNLSAIEQSIELVKRNRDRQQELFKLGISSEKQYEQAEVSLQQLTSQKAEAQTKVIALESELSRQANQVVLAPRDGIIGRIYTAAGLQVVKAGDIVAELIPITKSRAVEVFIDGNDAPLISEGEKVRIQFEGWPAIQFSGWPSVAVGTFPGVVGFVNPSDNDTGMFRVLVFPEDPSQWPDSHFLRQGVQAQAWFLLNEVSLGWELWRKFNGFPPVPAEK